MKALNWEETEQVMVLKEIWYGCTESRGGMVQDEVAEQSGARSHSTYRP